MAGVILTSVLKSLSTFISKASTSSSTVLQSPAEQELQKLQRTMERIHAVLEDAEEKDMSDKAEQLRLRELKEVAYDAEDAVDEYEYEVLHAKVEARRRARATHMKGAKQVTFDLNSYHPEVPISDELTGRVKDIRQRFEEITDDWNRISLREKDGKRRCVRKWKPTETIPCFDEAKTFGREDEKNEIIKWLLQEVEDSVSVLCIVGMGGLGKTTLAQMSYNDSRACQRFNLRGWVYVSEDFDVVNLVKKICFSFGMEVNSSNNMSLDQLHQKLKTILDGKEFFLVLDDVWNQKLELWNSLKTLLVGVGTGKILVTTRNQPVAKIMQTTSPIILSHLSPVNSWLLFKKIAYRGGDHNFLEIGKKIVDKCGGLPLAVKVLAGILSLEEEEQTWVYIMESELWNIDNENGDIFPILKLSYECLPIELKQCFMYLCLFPKGWPLDKSSIVQQWVSHGFIQPKGKKMEEDVGSDYWNEFLHRSILQYNERFSMHDLIHDLAQYVAKDEYLLMTSLKSHDKIPKRIRHISLHIKNNVDIINLKSMCEANHLRTLILSVGGTISIKNLLHNLRRLRILILDLWNFEDLPDAVGSMKHLRYLDICHAKSIPASVYNLHHLQTLRFFDLKINLLRDIGDLISLRHLYGNKIAPHHLPRGVVGQTNLQTLPYIHLGVGSESWKLRDLKELPNLRELRSISGLETVEWADITPPEAYLKDNRGIENLTLRWGEEVANVDERLATQVLDSLQPHSDLGELKIYDYPGVVLPTWLGHELPALKKLLIEGARRVKSFVLAVEKKSEEVESRRWFPSLEDLTLKRMDELEEWQRAEHDHDLSCLDGLYIDKCPKLRNLPFFANLSSLNISNCEELEWPGAEVHGLPCLHFLRIDNCPKVRYLPSLPRLSTLRIRNCYELEWQGTEDHDLLCLGILYIDNCTKLRNVPSLCRLSTLCILNWDELEWQGTEDHDLPSLRRLYIDNCPKLRKLPSLSRLSSLSIEDCPELKSLPSLPLLNDLLLGGEVRFELLINLPMLRSLDIDSYSDETLIFPHDGSLNQLEKLSISYCEMLRSVEGLSGLASLQKLTIYNCPLLSTWRSTTEDPLLLPTSTSLLKLEIYECPLLRISPDERLPPNLQDVKITESPGAEEWYQKQVFEPFSVSPEEWYQMQQPRPYI